MSITQGLNNYLIVVLETSESRNVVSYLDLLIDISNGDLVCSTFDKRNAFDFSIANFLDLSGNIPTAPGTTYMSELIRYSRACHDYDTFSSRQFMLAELRLLNQDFSARKLMRTFYKGPVKLVKRVKIAHSFRSVPRYHFKLAYVIL